jgi:hypothetical protein
LTSIDEDLLPGSGFPAFRLVTQLQLSVSPTSLRRPRLERRTRKLGKEDAMKLRVLVYPLVAVGVALVTGISVAAQNPDSARINTLLQQSKEHAARAHMDAEQIESFTRSRLDWRTHSAQIEHMRVDINELGKDIAVLSAARSEGSPWQQEAIDDIEPLLKSMADHMSAMIQHLNENQTQVHMPRYVDYAKTNYELSSKLLTMINDYVDYAEAKYKTEALEQKLTVAPNANEGEE